jgi:hypothetical protein
MATLLPTSCGARRRLRGAAGARRPSDGLPQRTVAERFCSALLCPCHWRALRKLPSLWSSPFCSRKGRPGSFLLLLPVRAALSCLEPVSTARFPAARAACVPGSGSAQWPSAARKERLSLSSLWSPRTVLANAHRQGSLSSCVRGCASRCCLESPA